MRLNQSLLARIGFALLFGWVMCLPYEGPLLYAFATNRQYDGTILNMVTVFSHFLGLFLAGFFVKHAEFAKKLMILAVFFCIVTTVIFPFCSYELWFLILPLASFISGLYISSFGFFYQAECLPYNTLKFAADLLIFGNVLLVLVHILTVNVSPYAGWLVAILALIISLVFTFNLKTTSKNSNNNVFKLDIALGKIWRQALFVLCVFIFVITINSGLMFQVIYPSFDEYETISSFYTNIPYILIIAVLRFLPNKMNKSYILYVGMALLGMAYIAFISLPISLFGYFLVITLMLSCCGIFDLFWWSTLGDMFQYTSNPAAVFGLGLSMNVFGVWCGGMMGIYILHATGQVRFVASIIALLILLGVLLLLPILNKRLSELIKDNAFMMRLYQEDKDKEASPKNQLAIYNLTEREKEITLLLMKGYTYKAVATELYISQNTIKTHIKNIYSKLNVTSKMELIRKINNITL